MKYSTKSVLEHMEVKFTITQLSLSSNTIRNLYQINGNLTQAIEWLIRMYMGSGFPAPHIVNDRSAKQIINVNISPYTIGVLNEFTSLGINHSQVVEWLVVTYLSMMKQVEQFLEQPKVPKAPKVRQLKTKKWCNSNPYVKNRLLCTLKIMDLCEKSENKTEGISFTALYMIF